VLNGPDVIAAFSPTYAEARAKFLAAARSRGLTVESHVHPSVRGATGAFWAIAGAAQHSVSAASAQTLLFMAALLFFQLPWRLDFHIGGFNPAGCLGNTASPRSGRPGAGEPAADGSASLVLTGAQPV